LTVGRAEFIVTHSFESEPVHPADYVLHASDRLGAYEIQSLIGVGGMGEVYRALDTRLGRTVAIKVLRTACSADADAHERLEREARAVAALNHQHICTLYDVGHADGIDYLVMEHLTGETLAARIAKGPLSIEQAIDLAIQIASALDSAHSVGIVHRDLKPGNIFLARTGAPVAATIAKLLDFGLAKPYAPVVETGSVAPVGSLELTQTGAFAGTIRYMAPEQLDGRPADARTDIFAFGAVIYEAISGRRAFDGATDVEVIRGILEVEPPPLADLQPATPALLTRIVTTCLAKNPDERWQTARDLYRGLMWSRDANVFQKLAANSEGSKRRRAWLPATVVAIIAAATIWISHWPWSSPPPSQRTVSFPVYPPEGTKFPRGTAEIAVAPDGRQLAFVALSADGTRRLWVRGLASVSAHLLEGTEGAAFPFWSPNSESIAFFTPGKLLRIAAAGGSPQVLCDVPVAGRGGTWSKNGTILFSSGDGLSRVSDHGGGATRVTSLDQSRAEQTHMWPVFLPDGQRYLYLARTANRDNTAIYQGALDSKEAHRIIVSESNVALAGQYLISLSNDALVAYRFDPDRAQVVGEPITVADNISMDAPLRSGAAFAAGGNVVLAFRNASPNSRLIWFDRSGKRVDEIQAVGDYHHPSLSVDEKRVAIEKTDPSTGRHTVWILDLARGVTSRLVSDALGAHVPVWSPDGSRVVFNSNRLGGSDLFWIKTDGTIGDELLFRSKDGDGLQVTDWSRDGRLLIYQSIRRGQADLWILPARPGAEPRPFLETPASERQGVFSPDMQWIAYTSDETGAHEVYLRRLADGAGKWQISTHGGGQPAWRRDGKELFYLSPDGQLMASDVIVRGPALTTGVPHALFSTGLTASFIDRRNQFVVTRDGQKFLVNISAEDENPSPITVVLNWTP
jgi:eukaryotic-like serine/threonine-protein kinase